MKILSLTLGGLEIPSSNFRLRCYYSFFQADGIDIQEINTKKVFKPQLLPIPKINAVVNIIGLKNFFVERNLKNFECSVQKADLIWVNKILKTELLSIVKKYNKKIILDIDDAIWIGDKGIVQENLDIAHTVIVGNEYLKNEIKKRFSGNVVLIPTTVNINDYPKEKLKSAKNSFDIGWLGSSFTNEYLQEIAPAINDFLYNHPDATFHIISSGFESLKMVFPKQTHFVEWKSEDYIRRLADFDVGIMPMPDIEWVKGKCSFKMLQYMAAHLPVIVSPYGMNAEVLEQGNCGLGAITNEEWLRAFEFMYEKTTEREALSRNGRKIVEEKYSTHSNYQLLKNTFLSIIHDHR